MDDTPPTSNASPEAAPAEAGAAMTTGTSALVAGGVAATAAVLLAAIGDVGRVWWFVAPSALVAIALGATALWRHRAARGTRHLRAVAAIGLGTLALTLAVAEGSSGSDDEGRPPSIPWVAVDEGVDEARFAVPADHRDPDGPSIELRLVRHRATGPEATIGTLLVNPGGPGFGGSVMALEAPRFFGPELLARFDIVGFDPRGTGESTPAIDCLDDYDAEYTRTDPTPEDDAERQAAHDAARASAEACLQRTGDDLVHMTTRNVARDMDLIRQALGEETISYLGTSYGCELGAAWATLFPGTVRAAVLDGCADPEADEIESLRQQAIGFQRSLEAFLALCLEVGTDCPIHNDGDPTGAFLAIRDAADRTGIPADPGRPAVNLSLFQVAATAAMYSEELWPAFAEGLGMAAAGDGSLLLAFADSYTQRRPDGTWGNELEAFQVISCLDRDEPAGVGDVETFMGELAEIAPLLYPPGMAGVPTCPFLPRPTEPSVPITGAGAGTILVIGNTGDPATPLASTERMAEALEGGLLLVVESNDHGGYGTNDCVDSAVHEYLLALSVPAEGTRC